MEAEEKTKYRDAAASEAAEVEAHKFVVEEPSEEEADKTKTKTKYAASRRDEDAGKYKY